MLKKFWSPDNELENIVLLTVFPALILSAGKDSIIRILFDSLGSSGWPLIIKAIGLVFIPILMIFATLVFAIDGRKVFKYTKLFAICQVLFILFALFSWIQKGGSF